MPMAVNRLGIERMLAGIEHDEGIDFKAEFDELACLGVIGNETQMAFFVGYDFAEQVEVGDEVLFSESPFGEFDEEAIAAVAVPVVAGLLIVVRTIFLQHPLFQGLG
jgi:hypothetical protein